MALDIQVAISKARVGSGSLRQHELLVLDGGELLVLASALSAPRLWGYMLDTVLAGFCEGLERPGDGRMSTRLHQAFDTAQRRVQARVEGLIERRKPDVGLLALAVDAHSLAREQSLGRAATPQLHVLCVGPARAYVLRRRTLRRLSPGDDRVAQDPEGVLRAAPAWCAEELEPGDLVFGGSPSACSEQTLGALQAEFEQGRLVSPAKLVQDLNGPAANGGLGAAAFAFDAAKF